MMLIVIASITSVIVGAAFGAFLVWFLLRRKHQPVVIPPVDPYVRGNSDV